MRRWMGCAMIAALVGCGGGTTGPAGTKGDVGATGPKGEIGPTGAIGPTGPTGGIGPVGPSGAMGLPGPTGPTGADGMLGPIGPTGPKGDPGTFDLAQVIANGTTAQTASFNVSGNGTVGGALVGTGGVGAGTAPGTYKLRVSESGGTVASLTTGNTSAGNAAIAEFRHDNLTQGVGIGFRSLFAAGSNANQDLSIFSRGASPLLLNADGGGGVAVGNVTPDAKLTVAGASGQNPVRIGDTGCGAAFAGIGLFGALGGCSNYALLGDNRNPSNLFVNRPSTGSIFFRSANVDQMQLDPAGELHVGALTVPGGAAGWGSAIVLHGGQDISGGTYNGDNSDPTWIARYNDGFNNTEVRLVIGDDPGQASDRFVVGTMQGDANFNKLAAWAPQFAVTAGGEARAKLFTTTGAPDLAETIRTAADVEAGDVVCADQRERERAVRCRPGEGAMLGVISDGSGGFLINARGGSIDAPLTGKPLVLAGRVPVKVSTENGAIQPGDLLAPSSRPGVAMRATTPGPTVGVALEAFAGPGAGKTTGTALAFIKVEHGLASAAVARLSAENDRLQGENRAMKERLARLETAVQDLIAQRPAPSRDRLATR